jgi:hypothetical protein
MRNSFVVGQNVSAPTARAPDIGAILWRAVLVMESDPVRIFDQVKNSQRVAISNFHISPANGFRPASLRRNQWLAAE